MPDASIVLKMVDQYSQQAKGVESANKGLSKSMEEVQRAAETQSKRLGELQSMAAQLKTSMSAAKQELKDAEKQFRATGEAADAEALTKAHEKYDALKSDLGMVAREAKDAEKALYNAGEQARRLASDSGSGGGGSGGEGGGLVSTLGKSGLVAIVTKAVGTAGSYMVGSTFGETTGEYVTDIVGGAAAGALAGSVIPGIGTAVGAVVGAVGGLVTAAVKDASKDDDYFREGVKSAYDEIQEYRQEQIEQGGQTYGGRETLLLSYKTLMGGDEEAAQGLYNDLLEYANRTPYTLGQLSGAGRTLLAYGYEGGEIQGVLNQIGAAAAATGSGAQGLETISTVIGRLNTGEISARLFRSLNSLGMNSYQTLADAYNAEHGTSYGSAEMKTMVSKGKITGEWAAGALLEQWGTNWGDSVYEFSQTLEGLTSTLEGLQENRQAYVGEQYAGERTGGMADEIEYLNSALGQTVTEIEGYYGIVEAHAENTQERFRREAEDALVNGTAFEELGPALSQSLARAHEDYVAYKQQLEDAIAAGDENKADEIRMNIYELLDKARQDAESAYTNSDFFHIRQENELKLVRDLQESTYNSWYQYGRMFGEMFSKGAMSVFGSTLGGDQGHGPTAYNGRAFGLSRVPYDGYLAELHEGERVLTASQARQQDAGTSGVTVNVNVSGATVRSDGDIDAIAEAVAGRIEETMRTYVR